MPQQKFGPYEVISELGRGGMATVYRAFDPRVGREVALKVLPREMLHDPQFRARFEREAHTIAALEHPAIVPIYDVGEEDGQPYFVMRFMDGGSLADRIKEKGAFSLQETADILSRLAPALDEAHAKGIIHRDLKPANILFDHTGQPYLSDFGIAKVADAAQTLTGELVIGTPTYISPEQAQGKPVDGRADIYALGVMLYQMLAGEVPYQADTPMGLLLKHISDPIPDITQARPDLPKSLAFIIEKALAKAPEDRFASAGEMAMALQHLIQESASQAEPTLSAGLPPTRQAASPPAAAGRKPFPAWMLWGGLGAFLLAVILGAGALLARRIPASVATPTVTAAPVRATATPQPAIPPTAAATNTLAPPTLTPSPTLSPTPAIPVAGGADKIAFLAKNNIWLMNVDGSELTQLTFDGAEKTGLQWLPDGERLLYRSGLCLKTVRTTDQREDILTCLNNSQFIDGARVSPDGSEIAISVDRELYLLPFQPDLLASLRGRADVSRAATCRVAADIATKDIRWSDDGSRLAVVFAGVAGARREDMIRILQIQQCTDGAEAVTRRLDEFPAQRFTMSGYVDNPVIPDFSWDGENAFLLHSARRNGGFGNLYVYYSETHKARQLIPIDNTCCYRDARWSPDGLYILFAFQDIRLGAESPTQLYFIPFGLLDTGATFTPLPLPGDFFDRTDAPQPVLRPAGH